MFDRSVAVLVHADGHDANPPRVDVRDRGDDLDESFAGTQPRSASPFRLEIAPPRSSGSPSFPIDHLPQAKDNISSDKTIT